MMDPFNDEYFMKQALVEACSAAEEGEVPVGAVIVCNNQIIARAHNQTERLNDPTAHAEMLAITAAVGVLGAKYLTGCSLYVTVEPCVMCAGAIGWSQLSKIVYGATDEKRGFQQYAPKPYIQKRQSKKGFLKTNAPKKCANSFSASAEQLISLPRNPHTLLHLLQRSFYGRPARHILRVQSCCCARRKSNRLFDGVVHPSFASEQDIFKGTQDRESH